jgi:hypothetical protein
MTAEKIKSGFNREVGKTAHEAKTRQRGDRLIERANSHFEKHSGAWINKRYGELLKSKAAPAPELTPQGGRESAGHKAHKAALLDVHNRHKNRISGIQKMVERTIENKGQTQGKVQKQLENKGKKNEIAR